jgi:peptidoglycan/xylan/chitin deacetylase (PgdA/CDA1 family)
VRAFFRKTFLDVFGLISSPTKCIHILNGHYVSVKESLIDNISFEKLVKKLSETYKLIDFEDACKKIVSGKESSHPELSFTFDDGFSECYSVIAPVLKKYDVSACFFINPSIIEAPDDFRRFFLLDKLKIHEDKYFMSWAEIKKLHIDGHIIGNHTMNHTALTGINYEEAYKEVYASKVKLENMLSYECKYFAFPYGNNSHFDAIGIGAALDCHDLAFTSCNYGNYFYNDNKKILSRRHFEGGWPKAHIDYFLSKKRGNN